MVTRMTDQAARARALARAERIADDSAWVVHREASSEIKERLSEVNRTFTNPLVLGPHGKFLDIAPGSGAPHDLVIHFMGLHWADDPVGDLIQARNALAPDGLFLGVFPAGKTLNELRAVLADAETRITGGLSPRVLPMGELRDLGGLLMRAGFALPVADTIPLDLRYSSLSALIHDLRATGETNALATRAPGSMRRAVFERAEALYREHFADAEGRLRTTVELVVLTGWAPSDSQQKPLRPGSAKARLSDALGTSETPLKDPVTPRRD